MQSIDAILLIHKKLTNQISSREKKILKAWLKEDNQHKVLYKDISLIWKVSKKLFNPLYYPNTGINQASLNNSNSSYNEFRSSSSKQYFQSIKKTTGDNKQSELFNKLSLATLTSDKVQHFKAIDFEVGLKPILQILSNAAIAILSEPSWKYHLNNLEVIEQLVPINEVFIADLDDKIIYASHPNTVDKYLMDLFPYKSIFSNKLNISEISEHTMISLPVFHQYGKIGTVIILLKEVG